MKERPLIIFDIDGTVADLTQRLHFINFNASVHGLEKDFKKNWPKFFEHCVHDEPIEKVIQLLHILQMFCDIQFFSGRSDAVRAETLCWLDLHIQLVSTPVLTMRKDGDHRPDYEVKQEMYDNLSPEDKLRLLCTFDDRDRVVQMWRANDVTCCQVANGNF